MIYYFSSSVVKCEFRVFMRQVILIFIWLIFSKLSFGQLKIGGSDCELFLQESLDPLINKDFRRLDSCVQFPLAGDWGFVMGLFVKDFQWNRKDFYMHFEKLFTPYFIEELRKIDCSDIEIYQGEGDLEYIVSIPSQEISDFENATLLRYRKIEKRWVLVTIQVVG